MNNGLATWESLILVLFMAAAIFFFFPGVKNAISASKDAPKDWPAVIVPLALVVIFVVVLIALV